MYVPTPIRSSIILTTMQAFVTTLTQHLHRTYQELLRSLRLNLHPRRNSPSCRNQPCKPLSLSSLKFFLTSQCYRWRVSKVRQAPPLEHAADKQLSVVQKFYFPANYTITKARGCSSSCRRQSNKVGAAADEP